MLRRAPFVRRIRYQALAGLTLVYPTLAASED